LIDICCVKQRNWYTDE